MSWKSADLRRQHPDAFRKSRHAHGHGFRAAPAKVFADAVENNRKLASTIEIDTPDAYLNAALPSAVLGFDAAWNEPTFRHGAIAWHDSFAGWRSTYAASPCGWHDRVQSHMHEFYTRQTAEGRIPSKLENDSIYNMGEVLVDQALYDYEWTGNLDPLRNGGFDAIARHLSWGEKHLKTPNGLYENSRIRSGRVWSFLPSPRQQIPVVGERAGRKMSVEKKHLAIRIIPSNQPEKAPS